SCRQARRLSPVRTAASASAESPAASSARTVSPEVRYFAASAPPAFSSAALLPSPSPSVPEPARATRTTEPPRSTKPSNNCPALPANRAARAPSASVRSRSSGSLSCSTTRAIRRVSPGSTASRKVICMLSPLDRVGGAANAPRTVWLALQLGGSGAIGKAMRPRRQTLPQVRTCALLSRRAVATAGLSALALCPPALAQDDTAAPAEAQADTREIAFEATAVSYDSDADTVTAEGDVLLRSGDQSVRADAVSWNRVSGEIVATGNIRFVDEDGNQLFTDRLELTEELRAGAMTNLLLAFRAGGRLAAVEARRGNNGNVILERAVYSGCAVEDEHGCPKTPSWRVTARRVFYDADANRIRFNGAYLELFGARVLPLPGLAIRSDNNANSGFLVPD